VVETVKDNSMATGISKTKWNGKTALLNGTQTSALLSYEGKIVDKEILSTPPAKVEKIYPMFDM
jgi:hypothetical protein